MNNLNHQFLLSVAIIMVGYILKKCGLIKEQDGECLARVVFNITIPALIIVTFNTIYIDFSLVMLTIISIIYGMFMALVGLWMFKKEVRTTRGMLSMVLPGFNLGLFAYPLVEVIWGQEGIKYFGMFDVGNSLIIFGISYLIASYFSTDSVEMNAVMVCSKLVKSVPLMASVISFCVAVAGWHFPGVLVDISQIISLANTPLSLLLLGIYLDFSIDFEYGRNMFKVLFFRYIAGLVIGTVLFFALPFNALFKYTLLIGFILPIALSVIPFSTEFCYNTKFVGMLTNITIMISFILIWFITGIMIPVS